MPSPRFDVLMDKTEGGFQLGVGAAAMVVVAFGAATFTDHASVLRLLVMVLAVGLGAALIPDWRYSAALGVIGYLISYYRSIYATDHVYLGILLALGCAFAANFGLSLMERRFTHWRVMQIEER